MLALPVATGVAGFIPSFLLLLCGWAFMTLTALLLAEANLWMEPGAHMIAMASRFLGPLGKWVAWLLYLFIGYASLVAYSAGGGDLFASALNAVFGIQLGTLWSTVLFVVIFGLIVYLGNIVVGRVNAFLMFGLIGAYVLLVGSGAPYVVWQNLIHANWNYTFVALPLLLTVFSFQTIIPSLTIYLKQDGRALRLSIICGTTLTLLFYVIWEWLVLGTVHIDGDQGLAAALAAGKPATSFLGSAVPSRIIGLLADFFAFFALTTSFLGIALGLFDFLADGLKIKHTRWGNVLLGFLVAAPTLFFAVHFENIFLLALDISGGIGDAILTGLMPALMVWVGRYRGKLTSSNRVPGGKPVLLIAICYSLLVFFIEVFGKVGWLPALGDLSY